MDVNSQNAGWGNLGAEVHTSSSFQVWKKQQLWFRRMLNLLPFPSGTLIEASSEHPLSQKESSENWQKSSVHSPYTGAFLAAFAAFSFCSSLPGLLPSPFSLGSSPVRSASAATGPRNVSPWVCLPTSPGCWREARPISDTLSGIVLPETWLPKDTGWVKEDVVFPVAHCYLEVLMWKGIYQKKQQSCGRGAICKSEEETYG